eukprot:1311306-Rhodomonas_salina.1
MPRGWDSMRVASRIEQLMKVKEGLIEVSRGRAGVVRIRQNGLGAKQKDDLRKCCNSGRGDAVTGVGVRVCSEDGTPAHAHHAKPREQCAEDSRDVMRDSYASALRNQRHALTSLSRRSASVVKTNGCSV